MQTRHFESLIIGSAGFLASHLASAVDATNITSILQAAVQVIIAVATLLSLFRKKKPV